MHGHKVVPNYEVRNERYKLIYYYGILSEDTNIGAMDFPAEWELYDLQEDPEEINNVYGNEQYAEVQSAMMTELDRLQEEALDTARH